MADITNYQAIPIKELLGDLSSYKYNPSLIQRRILDHLEDITSGQINIVDPTNPFIFLLEASCVNTALSIQENTYSLRKTYPALMQNEEDAYLHMSDLDYLDRFATPATANFTFYLELNSVLSNLVKVPNENFSKITIPRNTEILIDDITFSLQYPINISKHDSGIVQISYDASIKTPLLNLTTNIIDYTVRRDVSGVSWIVFKIPMTQFKITTSQHPIHLSRVFIENISYPDDFYFARIYQKTDDNSEWVEIKTTHTEQVYDPYTPTAVIKVLDGFIRVFIPPIYTMSEKIKGTVRIDVYGTKGNIDINFSNYPLEDFTVVLKAIDDVADLNTYTNAFDQITYFAVTDETVVSGSKSMSFTDLRRSIILNTIGDRNLPITQNQLQYYINNRGFEIYKQIDTLTDRIFVATRTLPASRDRYPITTIATTMDTLIDNISNIKNHYSVVNNSSRFTIKAFTIFENVNGKLRLLSLEEKDWLLSLPQRTYVETVNTKSLLVTPFTYVVDLDNNEIDLRSYYLNNPKLSNLNFVDQNTSLGFIVNTNGYSIEKTEFGFRIEIITKSGNFYKSLNTSDVGVQLIYKLQNQNIYAYLEGEFIGTTDTEERKYKFDIHTNHDIDKDDNIYVTNFRISTNNNIILPMSLNEEFIIIHYTMMNVPNYKAIEADNILGTFMSNIPIRAATHETIKSNLGYTLKSLWRHSRTSISAEVYETYAEDIPMFYEHDVYEKDPKTGLIFNMGDDCVFRYNLIHAKNEIVKDIDGNVIYKHRKGDVKLDSNGNRIQKIDPDMYCYLDILLLDYKAYVATRSDYKEYFTHTIHTIVSWVINNMKEFSDVLLERTKIFYMPKKNIGRTNVITAEGAIRNIDISQSLKVQYYVSDLVYKNIDTRSNIDYRTIKIISEYINNNRVAIADIITTLKDEFIGTIDSVTVSGLGGEYDLKLCYIEENQGNLSINKKLIREPNGELALVEDIEIEYIRMS